MKKTLDLLMMVLGTHRMNTQFSVILKGIGNPGWGLTRRKYNETKPLYLVTTANSLQTVVAGEHH